MERLLQLWEEEMEKVKQAGIQVGLLKGIEEGELRERINIAHTMIQAGENERKIKNYTKMTREEVEAYME